MKRQRQEQKQKKRPTRSRRKGWPRGKPRVGKGSSGGLAERQGRSLDGHVASVQLKKVFCKTCRRCKGHGPYRYLVYRKGGKVKWKYLGKAD